MSLGVYSSSASPYFFVTLIRAYLDLHTSIHNAVIRPLILSCVYSVSVNKFWSQPCVGAYISQSEMESTEFEYPGMTSECYPECFNIEAMPPQPKEKKPGQLPEHLVKQFFEEVCQSLYVYQTYVLAKKV